MIKHSLPIKIAASAMRAATKHYLALNPSPITQLPPPDPARVADKSYLLYIHVPFCASLCPYCSFNRFLFDESKASAYFEALRKEILQIKNLGYDFGSAYVGGGTTTIMPGELAKTLELIKKEFSIKEVSCESDPNQLSKETLDSLKGLVERLSVGVQSFDDEILKKIGRYEKFGSSSIVYERLKNAIGVLPILNVDLIFNFADQSEQSLLNDLKTVKDLAPEQVTTYPLMTSNANKKHIKRAIGESDINKEPRLYELILNELKDDYIQLSAWAFSKKGSEIFDEYVVQNDEYVGAGSGSFSFINGKLYVNTFSLKEYATRINSGLCGVVRERAFNRAAQERYRLMVDLFGGKARADIFGARWAELLALRAAGYIFRDGDFYRPTQKGQYMMLNLMKEFYIGMDGVREQSRAKLTAEDM